jgi:hypothetical protein
MDVARKGKKKMHGLIWLEGLNGRKQLRDPGVEGRIIIKWIFIWGVAVVTIDTESKYAVVVKRAAYSVVTLVS